VPLYELRCAAGHRFEILQPFSAPLPACACGARTAKRPSAFGVGGSARLPPPAERMPQTWKGTYRGDRDYLRTLRRTAEQRRDLEERHSELAGDRRPIAAHEGRFEGAPLRAGAPPPASAGGDDHGGSGHDHGGSGHGHGHRGGGHGHGGAHGHGAGGSPPPPAS
jgi:hypothetical protein